MWQAKEERVQREQAKKDADKKYKVPSPQNPSPQNSKSETRSPKPTPKRQTASTPSLFPRPHFGFDFGVAMRSVGGLHLTERLDSNCFEGTGGLRGVSQRLTLQGERDFFIDNLLVRIHHII